MKNVPNLGPEAVVQEMRYGKARENMEPLCDHCRKKLTNIILPSDLGRPRYFQLGDCLFKVEMLT